ncbi:cupin domain-containing protein [Maritalea porphyrae]|uniref:cupin domain-containing protein n=1 Tax=Maritalea porphyrae TaxID=880732 RepID=UPI0022AFD8EA|nr:cupin domain-containing protein [Maritalea porphyrae]MCZ4273868.1 cupin domain-containing protein [Maritalea porphyrae]
MGDDVKAFVRLADLETTPFSHGKSYESYDAPVAKALGLTKLGAAYTVVPPGKTACPYHVHHAEDEMFIVLSGSGEYRFGDTVHQVQAGDVLGAPVGGAEFAHQLWNRGNEPLIYLAISSKADVDVCEYPDTGKFAVMSGSGKTRRHGQSAFAFVGRAEQGLDYFDGDADV